MTDTAAADRQFMALATAQARQSLDAGGVPVGAVLVRGSQVIGAGHNRRVQSGDPIAHGEMDCIRKAGRQTTYKDTALYTTLSPCLMCAGTIVQFGIPRVVIGENCTFGGNEEFLRGRGVDVAILDDPQCKALIDDFIRRFPHVWNEDIGR
jgi:cytosine/creatinine deaminase